MYPYIASLKDPSLCYFSISAQLFEPTTISDNQRQALILLKPHEVSVYKIINNDHTNSSVTQTNHSEESSTLIQHVSTQPIFTQVLGLKKIKWFYQKENALIRKDFLFMISKDLKLQLLHFNQSNVELQVISTFQIDLSFGGKELKEISYITYDQNTQTVIIIFAQNYVLTVNIEKARSLSSTHNQCSCEDHLEITNFTITEIPSERAVYIKKIVRFNTQRGLNESFLGLLYDILPSNNAQNPNELLFNHLKLHQIQSRRDGEEISTFLSDEAISIPLNNSQQELIDNCSFHKFTYDKRLNYLVLFAYQGLILYDLNFDKLSTANYFDNFMKFISLDHFIQTYKWISEESLFLLTDSGIGLSLTIPESSLQQISLNELQQSESKTKQQNYQGLNSPIAISQLDQYTLLLVSDIQDHQFIRLNEIANSYSILGQISNWGPISEMKKYKNNGGVLLNKGANQSRLIYLKDGVEFTEEVSIEIETQLNDIWVLSHDEIILGSIYGDSKVIKVGKSQVAELENTFAKDDLEILNFKKFENQTILVDSNHVTYRDQENCISHHLCSEIQNSQILQEQIVILDCENKISIITKQGIKQSYQFSQDSQVHGFKFLQADAKTTYALFSFWNQSVLRLYEYPNLENHITTLNLLDHITFESFQIDKIEFVTLGKDYYIFVALNNGFLVTFNFYPQMFKTLQNLNIGLSKVFRMSNIFKIGDIIYDIKQISNNRVMICSDQSKILTQAPSSKSKYLECKNFSEGDVKLVQSLGDGRVIIAKDGVLKIGTLDVDGTAGSCIEGNESQAKEITLDYMVQKFDYIESEDIICMCCFDSINSDEEYSGQNSLLVLLNAKTQKPFYSKYFSDKEKPSSIKYHRTDDGRHLIYLGTSIMGQQSEISPQSGNVYVFELNYILDQGLKEYTLIQKEIFKVGGAILDIEIMKYDVSTRYLLLAVNSYVLIYNLNDDFSQYRDDLRKNVGQISVQTYVHKIKAQYFYNGKINECTNRFMVGDIMKSLTIYEIAKSEENQDEEDEGRQVEARLITRDPRGQFCLDMVEIDEDHYLIADFHSNILMLEKDNTLKLFGGMNMRQMVYSINDSFKQIKMTQERYQPEAAFLSHQYLQSHSLPLNQSFFDIDLKIENLKNIGSRQPILGTSDGGVYMAIMLEHKAYSLLKCIQEALNDSIVSLGFQHSSFRKLEKVEIDKNNYQFLDGNFIELLLDLPEEDQYRIVSDAKQRLMQSVDKVESFASQIELREIRMLIEYLRQIHQ